MEDLLKPKSNKRLKADFATEERCNTCICVLENPANFTNVGTVLRNVNAMGIAKLYVVDGRNIFQGKSWEEFRTSRHLMDVSVSAVKWTYVRIFQTTDDCFNHLEKKNFVSVCTSPHILGKNNVLLSDGTFTQKKLAVWFGNEVEGISSIVTNRCEQCVQIGMHGMIESLNLGTSTGIVLHEIANQRRQFKKSHKRFKLIN